MCIIKVYHRGVSFVILACFMGWPSSLDHASVLDYVTVLTCRFTRLFHGLASDSFHIHFSISLGGGLEAASNPPPIRLQSASNPPPGGLEAASNPHPIRLQSASTRIGGGLEAASNPIRGGLQSE